MHRLSFEYMRTRKFLFLMGLVCFGWLCRSCEPIRSYSDIPEIQFKKLVFVDSIDNPILNNLVKYAVLSFSFIDGNGDLGARKPDGGLSRIHYTWYKKLPDQSYEPFQFDSDEIGLSSAIPYNSVMDKSEAQNKTLKGTIEIKLETPKNQKDVDTMRVEFYIVDRAGNKSVNKEGNPYEYTPDFSIMSETGTVITN